MRRYSTVTRKLERAAENRAYLHVLLLEKEPGFLAALERAIYLVDRELSGDRRETPGVTDWRTLLALRVRQAVLGRMPAGRGAGPLRLRIRAYCSPGFERSTVKCAAEPMT
jgi:hypothetical protein